MLATDEILPFDEELFADVVATSDALYYKEDTTSLEEAGLEEDTNRQAVFGNVDHGLETDPCLGRYDGSVMEYVKWFSDGEDSRFEDN